MARREGAAGPGGGGRGGRWRSTAGPAAWRAGVSRPAAARWAARSGAGALTRPSATGCWSSRTRWLYARRASLGRGGRRVEAGGGQVGGEVGGWGAHPALRHRVLVQSNPLVICTACQSRPGGRGGPREGTGAEGGG